MIAIDTNILIRLIAQDDAKQFKAVLDLFAKNQIWISKTVLLESEWVMRGILSYTHVETHTLLTDIIDLENVHIEAYSVIQLALDAFFAGMDFADAIHLYTANAKALSFRTFDRALVKHAHRNNASAERLKS